MNALLFQPIQFIEAVKIIQACCSSLSDYCVLHVTPMLLISVLLID